MRDKLREIRVSKNLTQSDIANIIGVDRVTYTNIELGNKNPSLKVAIKIKKALKYYNDDIFLNIN